ncbi:hypothetical protein J437_LFUL002366 [Ladona fulva]|uniref:Coilin n=1 Tax=Ladona fulva TaxID=123851 RepID=A0A8K0K377_LADFU|nr:hypothetical protein J437_LFUL002366 [Ladona fulva]
MEGFRVLVNLSHHFSDYRQKSWVYVDPNRYKTLSDLKKHICEVFAIDDDFEIFVCDSYIPSKEDVGIINEKDVLELRKSTGEADVTVTIRDVFITPMSAEEVSRKRRKKRRNHNLDSQLETDESVDNVDPLPENFHPEYNSTMTSRKKRKKTQRSSIEEFAESSPADESNKLGKRKSNPLKENCWNAKEVACSSSVQIPNEDIENSTPVCMVMEHEKSSTVKSTSSTRNSLETNVNYFREINSASEVKEVVSVGNCNVLFSAQSINENSPLERLEHTIFEGDTAEREGEIVDLPLQKKKRNRRGKRKQKKTSSSNHASLDLTTNNSNVSVSTCKQQSFINAVPNSRKHMRFSDSGDDEEVSALQNTENNSIDTNGRNESCSGEANGSVSVSIRQREFSRSSSKLGKECMAEASSVGDEKRKKYDLNPHDQECGRILRYEFTNEVKDDKTSCELQSSPLPVVRWRKKAVLNTGLGATLAHLMKNVKTSEICNSNSKVSNVMAVVQTQPPPSIPEEPSSSSKNYTEFPIVEKFPREGDILAFKILKMNDHYEPCVSSFIESVVTACDQNQSTVTMRILVYAKTIRKKIV